MGRVTWPCRVRPGRWERGVTQLPDPLNRQLLAELFEVSLQVLGYAPPRTHSDDEPDERPGSPPSSEGVDRPLATRHIEQSQDDWKSVRQTLNQQRG